MVTSDTVFSGSIPAIYDRLMAPLLFEPWAEHIASRIKVWAPGTILETAAGTGIVTEKLAKGVPSATIIATDLNPAMLAIAATRSVLKHVTFQPADAQMLPFDDARFDAVICQFGVMFFPDRIAAAREARRVLKPDGVYLFSTWNGLDANPVSELLSETVAALFPDSPPSFYARVPFGYHDTQRITADLSAAGFSAISIDTRELPHGALTAHQAAEGLCHGSPYAAEIAAHGDDALDRAVDAGARALEQLCGADGRIDARMSAHLVTAQA